jgi:hypothetical protein
MEATLTSSCAVEENVAHGLALLQADRRAAAERLLASHPHMSDRAVGHSAGSAAKTVAVIRKRSSGEVPQSNARVGRDGRVRPLNGGERRRRAADLLAERLEASLRDVARLRGQRRPGTQPLSCRSCCTAPRFAAVSREKGLLRLLYVNAVGAQQLPDFAASAPLHCVALFVQRARQYAKTSQDFATELDGRARVIDASAAMH